MTTKTHDSVQDYYGKVLKQSSDLKTNACCTAEAPPKTQQEILKMIEPDVLNRYYGCGLPIPPALQGLTVLDLGSGSGRDAYLLSKLVGETGHVIGVDMTDEQLEVARKYQDSQAKRFGFSKSNVTFTKGYIENLTEAGIKESSVDLVVSNCVINLSPDKPAVFRELFRALKPGGELYISDVFSDRRVPQSLKEDEELYGECLSGALYIEDFRRQLAEIGIHDFRVVEESPITIENEAVERKIGMINFKSLTIRAFKAELEDRCEDYGQVATYQGGMSEAPHYFDLDDHHRFFKGKPMLVCGNTADMIEQSRYGKFFSVVGHKKTHYGIFDCEPEHPSLAVEASTSGACC